MNPHSPTSPASDLEVLNPVRLVPLGARQVRVTELPLFDAFELVQRVMTRLGALLDAEGKPRFRNNTDAVLLLVGVLAQSKDDVQWLLARTTPLTADEIGRLGTSGAFRLLTVAVELTLNDEFIEAGKSLAGRLERAVGLKWASSSTSSSGKDTPGPTSGPTPSAS